MIVLKVDGKPTGKGRPRFVKATGRTYTPGDTARAENRVQLAWIDAGRPRIDGPVWMTVIAVLERPKSHYRVNGTLNAQGQRHPIPVRKPDVDNLLKLAMDALQGHAYGDDVNVMSAQVMRRWAQDGEHEHTRIRIGHVHVYTYDLTPGVRSVTPHVEKRAA
jgi:Holliday junction resolvase RusA-like endonuclease